MYKRDYCSGFSLIELIAVIVIMAVLALVVSPSFFGRDAASVQTTRNNIIMAFSQAQQIAMAQGNASVVLTETSVDVQANNVSVSWPGTSYPYSFPSDTLVTNTATAGTWTFDKLGRTQAGTVVISGQQSVTQSITVEASGYAY